MALSVLLTRVEFSHPIGRRNSAWPLTARCHFGVDQLLCCGNYFLLLCNDFGIGTRHLSHKLGHHITRKAGGYAGHHLMSLAFRYIKMGSALYLIQ
jgi:hypothetical protein